MSAVGSSACSKELLDGCKRCVVGGHEFLSPCGVAFGLSLFGQLEHLLASFLAVQVVLQILFASGVGHCLVDGVAHQEEGLEEGARDFTTALLVHHIDGLFEVLVRTTKVEVLSEHNRSRPVVVLSLYAQHVAQGALRLCERVQGVEVLLAKLEEFHHLVEVPAPLDGVLFCIDKVVEHKRALRVDAVLCEGRIRLYPLVVFVHVLIVLVRICLLEHGDVALGGLDGILVVASRERDALFNGATFEILCHSSCSDECEQHGESQLLHFSTYYNIVQLLVIFVGVELEVNSLSLVEVNSLRSWTIVQVPWYCPALSALLPL